jgi:hypothetical protein
MNPLGRLLPSARYEVWVFQHDLCREIESDALLLFRQHFKRLPLGNRKGGGASQIHEYEDSFSQVADADRRYWWALVPVQRDVKEYFKKGMMTEPMDY